MNSMFRRSTTATVGLVVCLASMVALAQSPRGISKVNGGITVDAGETVGNLSTVNGGIRINANAVAGKVNTVNGAIRMDEGARAGSLDSVNGSIRLAEKSTLTGDISGVNGAITLAPQARVDGDVDNVSGTITLDAAQIGGSLSTVNGPVLIGSGSVVEGGLTVNKSNGISLGSKPPRIVIGPDAEVRGDLVFERDVELYVHDTARIGRVEGATAQRFSGSQP